VPDRYPAIEDHAVIGDLRTVALVAVTDAGGHIRRLHPKHLIFRTDRGRCVQAVDFLVTTTT
jgi:hypothetical protein